MDTPRRYCLEVYDEDTQDLVFQGEYLSEVSMIEDLHKVDKAFEEHEDTKARLAEITREDLENDVAE